MKYKILAITPVGHIEGVMEILEKSGSVTYLEDPTIGDILPIIHEYDAIYTNPNKSKIYLGTEIFNAATKLKVIGTASTGTVHIDMKTAEKKKITVLHLKEEREVINRISSAAELAFTLTMCHLRNVIPCHQKALNGEWDYSPYIGRQMDALTVGVIGYGRLGYFYAKYCKAFGSRVIVFDPYQKVQSEGIEQTTDLDFLYQYSDIISLHVHVNPETTNMINAASLSKMKKNVLLVNTSRGEMILEMDLVQFLRENKGAKAAVDVIANEVSNRENSPIIEYAKESAQILITQHIGGVTKEAQQMAYGHIAKMLNAFLGKYSGDN